MIPEPRRRRDVDTDFLTERYHRAFDDELRVVRDRLQSGPIRGLRRSLDRLGERLFAHNLLQEMRLFPSFDAGSPCPATLRQAHAEDARKLFAAVEEVRAACRDVDGDLPIMRRLGHLLDEIQEHLAVEASLFGRWTAGHEREIGALVPA